MFVGTSLPLLVCCASSLGTLLALVESLQFLPACFSVCCACGLQESEGALLACCMLHVARHESRRSLWPA